MAGEADRLPDRTFRGLAVAEQHPSAVGQPVDVLAGEGDADGDGQAVAEGAGGDVDPRDGRRGVTLEPAAEVPDGEQLVVADGAGGLEKGVQKRGSVAL